MWAKDPKSIPPTVPLVFDLPPAGKWVRLEVPVSAFGLDSEVELDTMAFLVSDGKATWDFTGVRNSTWMELVSRVPEFLRRTGITYDDLISLLETRFINPDPKSPAAITLFTPDSKCDLESTELRRADGALPDEAFFSRIHRLIRLWRRLD